jgi:hypothetical protein
MGPSLTTLVTRSTGNQRSNYDPLIAMFFYRFGKLCVFFWCPFTLLPIGSVGSLGIGRVEEVFVSSIFYRFPYERLVAIYLIKSLIFISAWELQVCVTHPIASTIATCFGFLEYSWVSSRLPLLTRLGREAAKCLHWNRGIYDTP